MTDVRVLELVGDGDATHLQLLQDRLETLAAVRTERRPHFRLLELCVPNEHGGWPAIAELRQRARRLLGRTELLQRLLAGEAVQLEVSGAPRALPATWDALRAQARLQRPMIVLECFAPHRQRDDNLRMLEAWRRMLEDAPPHIERAAPAQLDDAEAAATATLRALLADPERFLDSATVGRQLAGNQDLAHPKMVTTRARQARRIYGSWDGNSYRYPAFQFDADGQPRAAVRDLIEVLPRDPGPGNDGGRDAALWLFAPDAALGGRTPAEVFVDDPAQVIELARRRRDGDDAMD